MMRLALFSIAYAASSLAVAPAPKELKANGTPAGTWQLLNPDPQKLGQFLPSNQSWIIDAEYGVIVTVHGVLKVGQNYPPFQSVATSCAPNWPKLPANIRRLWPQAGSYA